MNTMIFEQLKDVPVGRDRLVSVVALTILNAGVFVNDSNACAIEARAIYSKPRGMWKQIEKDAKRVLNAARFYRLSFQRPTLVSEGHVFGLDSQGRLIPLFAVNTRWL